MDPVPAATSVAAAPMPLPFDIGTMFQQGPLIGIIGLLLWWIIRQQDRFDQQLAAERALNAKLQEQRVEDQKVLIPLGNSMVVAAEQSHDLVKRMLDK